MVVEGGEDLFRALMASEPGYSLLGEGEQEVADNWGENSQIRCLLGLFMFSSFFSESMFIRFLYFHLCPHRPIFFSRCTLVCISLTVSILRGSSHLLKESALMCPWYPYIMTDMLFRSIQCFTIVKDPSRTFSSVLFVLCRFPCIWEGNLSVWE